jgi:hypothetical protein
VLEAVLEAVLTEIDPRLPLLHLFQGLRIFIEPRGHAPKVRPETGEAVLDPVELMEQEHAVAGKVVEFKANSKTRIMAAV